MLINAGKIIYMPEMYKQHANASLQYAKHSSNMLIYVNKRMLTRPKYVSQ